MIPTAPGAVDETTPLVLSRDNVSLKGNTIYVYLVAGLSAIGGFLFGYDTGIISGAMIFVRDEFHMNELWQEAVVSSTLLTAWLFSVLAGSATNRCGRKPVIVGSSLIFVAGSLLMSLAHNALVLLLGRLVVGAAVGLASMTVPMYIAEVAPSQIRGQLVMINMCCITGGQFIASLIAYWFASLATSNDGGWRYMLGFAALPAAVQFFAFLAMPESPRWLMAQKRYEEAKQVLAKIRPSGADIEAEFGAIRQYDLQAKRDYEVSLNAAGTSAACNHQSTYARIMASQPVRKALLVGCLLQMVQQISGINTVMYYTASIFQMAGVHSKPEALLLSSGTALVNFVFTLVGFALVERAGRRKLTLFSLFGVILSLSLLAASFQFAYVNSPKVTNFDHAPLNQPCDSLGDCSSCSSQPECGFCFSTTNHEAAGGSGAIITAASCLRVNSSDHERSLVGNCSAGSTSAAAASPTTTTIYALEWCPSSYGWLTMLGMALYLMFFAPGMGPMPWTINSEIYPSWARSWCLSATTSVNWLFNLIMSMSFLSLTRLITKQGAFYLYAALASLGFVYFALVLPETRGKTLEELEDLFATSKLKAKRIDDDDGNDDEDEHERPRHEPQA